MHTFGFHDAPMEEAIGVMTAELSEILGPDLHSVWLYGSVPLGDFRLGWSDIDLMVFTNAPLDEKEADRLVLLRQRLTERHPGSPYYRLFEGVVVPLEEFRAGRYRRLVYWGTSGQRVTDRWAPDAFSLYELSHDGVCLHGEPDREIFPRPSREELTAAVRGHLEAIRSCAVQTDERLYSCGWLLDIAPGVYTLRTGRVAAKTEAGEWALRTGLFDDPAPLERTLKIRRSPMEYRDLPETRQWLQSLGPTVQAYADVLERELSLHG